MISIWIKLGTWLKYNRFDSKPIMILHQEISFARSWQCHKHLQNKNPTMCGLILVGMNFIYFEQNLIDLVYNCKTKLSNRWNSIKLNTFNKKCCIQYFLHTNYICEHIFVWNHKKFELKF